MPGPREPEQNINTYLCPLVDDLFDLWHGMVLVSESSVKIRAALLDIATDLLALRKIS